MTPRRSAPVEGVDAAPIDEVPARGRRRSVVDTGDRPERLTIPHDVQARYGDEWDLRWLNDEKNRIAQKTRHGEYDLVEEVEPEIVGTDKYGQPIRAYLAAIPKDIRAEDQQRKLGEAKRRIDERLATPGAGIEGGEVLYAAKGNRISQSVT